MSSSSKLVSVGRVTDGKERLCGSRIAKTGDTESLIEMIEELYDRKDDH